MRTKTETVSIEKNIVVLRGYSAPMVSRFLKAVGIEAKFAIVKVEYTEDGERIVAIGLEPLDEKTEFYWTMQGGQGLKKALDGYIAKHEVKNV